MSGAAVPERRREAASLISNQVVSICKRYLGRGPTKARTIIRGDVVVCVLEDALTRAERALAADGKAETVLHLRREIQDTMQKDLVAAVEDALGRTVVAFMSANHVEPDCMAEIFMLDAEVTEELAGEAGAPLLSAVPDGA